MNDYDLFRHYMRQLKLIHYLGIFCAIIVLWLFVVFMLTL
jgi:hypothetical protein